MTTQQIFAGEAGDQQAVDGPVEVGHFIPAGAPVTNNVEVDERGYVYIVDRGSLGLHILELSGAARRIANLP